MGRLTFNTKDKKGNTLTSGSFEVKNQTDTEADLYIMGDIVSDGWGKWCDDDTCPADILEFLKELDGVGTINLHINSGGGSVYAGIAIYNMLKRHEASVTTYVDGIAASIASVIACAGDRIIMPANATFMIHKPAVGYFLTSMNADDLRKDADMLDICQKSILTTYMSKAAEGVTEEQMDSLINDETWMVGTDVTQYFDFEIEESNQAAACKSALFEQYEKTPKALFAPVQEETEDGDSGNGNLKAQVQVQVDVDAVVEKVISTLKNQDDEKNKKEKEEILAQLWKYGA